MPGAPRGRLRAGGAGWTMKRRSSGGRPGSGLRGRDEPDSIASTIRPATELEVRTLDRSQELPRSDPPEAQWRMTAGIAKQAPLLLVATGDVARQPPDVRGTVSTAKPVAASPDGRQGSADEVLEALE